MDWFSCQNVIVTLKVLILASLPTHRGDYYSCRDNGGVLSGKYNTDLKVAARFNSYLRSNDSRIQAMAHRFLNEKTLVATARYMEIAANAGISPVTLAVAWSKQFDFVASTIIGVTSLAQLDDSLAAMDLDLSEDILADCDAVHADILYPMGKSN